MLPFFLQSDEGYWDQLDPWGQPDIVADVKDWDCWAVQAERVEEPRFFSWRSMMRLRWGLCWAVDVALQ